MELSNQELERLAREGAEALRLGRAKDARDRFTTVTGSGRGGAQMWLLLALACRADGDAAAEEAALDRLFTIEPQHVRGLIMKGDCRMKAGDDRTAVTLYKTALRFGSEQPSLPQDVLAALRHADTMARQLEARYAVHLEASLAAQGLPPELRSARFQHSLDIIAGRRQIYIQEPTAYFFPELPQTQFYDPAAFDWVPALEAAADAIREELRAVLAGGREGFCPYIRAEPNVPRDHPLLDNDNWSALFLCENGRLFEEAIARCPRTWEAVGKAPLAWIERSSPTIMFSLLRPRTRIPAHTGMQNTRLICHLPLILPPDCRFRVGNETREWQEGKLLIFDDTIEHEAWNDSGEDRVVLIFDIWRPELSDQERREVAALFAIPEVGAGAPAA
jgi:hypothetical protein